MSPDFDRPGKYVLTFDPDCVYLSWKRLSVKRIGFHETFGRDEKRAGVAIAALLDADIQLNLPGRI